LDDANRHAVTDLLLEWKQGRRDAFDRLLPIVYRELHRLARRHMAAERAGHTLQTTALVQEACLRLMGSQVDWRDRLHFFAVASRVMRRVLVDHARAHRSAKRGGDKVQLPLDEAADAKVEQRWDLLVLDEALERLAGHDARKAQVVDLHFFGGLTFEEIAELLGVTHDAVAWDLRMAKAWLRRELETGGG
jgi:RNA polymerase sigma factor (TIGR02999 family)